LPVLKRHSYDIKEIYRMDQKIRIGIVGCGEVTQIIHLPSLYQLDEYYKVTALCDISPKTLNGVGDQWNIEKRCTDYRDLSELADVDAVLIANPPAFHTDVALAAIAAGKHVLIEKPMCITLAEADAIIEAQQKAGVIVQVGYMRRYAPAFIEGCRMVSEMGPIRMARVHDLIGSNALIIKQSSRVIRGNDLSEATLVHGRDRYAQSLHEALGDVTPSVRRLYSLLLGLSSHDLSAMREMLGMPRGILYAAWREDDDPLAEKVKPIGRYISTAFDYGSFVCHFETGVDNIPRFDAHLQVFGDNQVIRVQYDTPYVRNLPIRLLVTETNGGGGVREEAIHPSWGDPFVSEWQAFHVNVSQGKKPKTDPADFRQDLTLFLDIVQRIQQDSQGNRELN
jgi:predicted dehydrogenase